MTTVVVEDNPETLMKLNTLALLIALAAPAIVHTQDLDARSAAQEFP